MRLNPSVRIRTILPLIALSCLVAVGCEDSAAPELPSSIEIEGGDGQYSKHGTELPEPLQVRVRFANGNKAGDYRVDFKIVELDGTLSHTSANTNSFGIATTRLTLPDQNGTVRVRASLAVDPALYVDLTATSADFYCPEEDPTFVRKFFNEGPIFNDLFLFTGKSSLFDGKGIVKVTPGQGQFDAKPVLEFSQDISLKVVRDAAFAANGDFFIAWSYQRLETVKILPDFSYDERGFSALESIYGSEITAAPMGILVGCDEYGPFTIGCRDTLARFDDALYPGVDANDYANGDAVAVDPATEDIYYIHQPSNVLMRLPVDTLLATGPPETVVQLSADEAETSGMVVDDQDGSVYLLVDSDNTRSIVKVTSAGVKTTEVNFFTERGDGDLAGRQDDLTIDRQYHFLYTVDRLNNVLLLYDINQHALSVLTPNPSSTDPEALSTNTSESERIGLAVLPRSAP